MKASKLTTVLTKTIEAGESVLITGAPGIGKSDVVAKAAKAAGAKLLVSHPVVSDPTDFKGMPAVVDGEAHFLPFGDLQKLIDADEKTVCFLDDLGQSAPAVQAAAMQLILARRINDHKVSDHVVFVAATNRRQDKAGVSGILEPVKSRFASIIELEVDVKDWTNWAMENEVPAEVIAFIRFRPELLMDTEKPSNEIVNRPSPRTVTAMGRLYKLGLDDHETLAGAVGQGLASEYLGFIKVFKDLPSIEGILEDPKDAPVPTEPAALYAVSTALAMKAKKKTAEAIITYAGRLPEEFNVLCVRDTTRQYPKAAETDAFIEWSVEHQDALM
jgi:hypothetical protein